jgi:hypothetical protein
MVRHFTSACVVLSFTIAAAYAAPAATGPAVPAEILALKGKVVRIHHDIDLIGAGKPSFLHTAYLNELLERAGATVMLGSGRRVSAAALEAMKDKKRADVVIFGEPLPSPQFSPAELADPFIKKKFENIRQEVEQYVAARPKLEQEAAAAGARVIKSADVAAALGLRGISEAQMKQGMNERAREALRREIGAFKADQLNMTDVVDFLRDVSQANIFVNWRALEAAGVNRKTPITFDLPPTPLGEVLDNVLSQAAAGKNTKLAYTIDQGVIMISTVDEVKLPGR